MMFAGRAPRRPGRRSLLVSALIGALALTAMAGSARPAAAQDLNQITLVNSASFGPAPVALARGSFITIFTQRPVTNEGPVTNPFPCPTATLPCNAARRLTFSLTAPGGQPVEQPLSFYGPAGFPGREQANIQIHPQTTAGAYRLRWSPGTRSERMSEIKVAEQACHRATPPTTDPSGPSCRGERGRPAGSRCRWCRRPG